MRCGGELNNVKLQRRECVMRKSAPFTSLPRCVGVGWLSNKTRLTEALASTVSAIQKNKSPANIQPG
jgi:hypothetical protein